MTTASTFNLCMVASWYAHHLGWYVFPLHNPIFDASGHCTGCTCEHYRRSEQCQQNHPYLYLGQDGKCANPGKCPRMRWSEKSTVDANQIYKWWGRPWRDTNADTGRILANVPNIGIDCGKSNLLVFDADLYKDTHGDLGNLLTWADRQTVTAITGGGGEHLIYDRQGKFYTNSTGELPPGVDIRGVGGYIVAAPSMHKSGRRYQFEEGYSPRLIKPLPIPVALDDLLRSAQGDYADTAGESDSQAVNRAVRVVQSILKRKDLQHFGMQTYGDGRRWVLKECPFNPHDNKHPDDSSAFIVVLANGRICAGCHHNRCQKRIHDAKADKLAESAWHLLRQLTGCERRRVLVMVEATL